MKTTFTIEVAYAGAHHQTLLSVDVLAGTTAIQAVQQSKICDLFPELNEKPLSLGVFGQKIKPDYVLGAGERIEIYRPLTIDPKDARRLRAKKLS